MNDLRKIEQLLPFYLNGTLGADERKQMEDFLAANPQNAAMLDLPKELLSAADHPHIESRLAELHPLLLVQYAENRGQLSDEERAGVEHLLANDATSRSALTVLRQVDSALAAEGRTQQTLGSIWHTLRASLLGPVPAMAYLLCLALLVPLWVRQQPQPASPSASVPVIISTTSEPGFRGENESPLGWEPLVLPKGADPAFQVLVRIQLDLTLEEITRRNLAFDLVLLNGNQVIWSEPRSLQDFEPTGNGSTLSLLLYPARLDTGNPYRLELRTVLPGDLLDGQALFVRTFLIRE